MFFNPSDLLAVAPEITTLVIALLVLLVELLITKKDENLQAFAGIGVLLSLAVTVYLNTSGKIEPFGAFSGMIASDDFTIYSKVLLGSIAFLIVLISRDYLKDTKIRHGEYYSLILMCTVGMMVLASATHMITMFLGIETMSIGLYILAGLRSDKPKSNEAALKYLLLGAFATGFLLYGIALIYGGTGGEMNFTAIGKAISATGSDNAPIYLYAGIALVMIGLLFKVAAIPFHFWSPDVYQGAPTPVTAFMSAGPKAAALLVFLRLFGWALPDMSEIWQPALWVVAAVTMLGGNIIALAQHNIKRMLAYSSISHAGYLLLAILASSDPNVRPVAASGMLFYLVAYYLMNIGAFTVAIMVDKARKQGDYEIESYHGLAAAHPWTAAAMALFMVSLAGIPPTAGFFGKLYVFSAAVEAGHVTLVVIAVLASVISAFYYLRIVVFMFMKPRDELSTGTLQFSGALRAVILICALIILQLGILPETIIRHVSKYSNSIIVPDQTGESSYALADSDNDEAREP